MQYQVSINQGNIEGEIQLAGSKSISNRVLIIRALSAKPFEIHHLANADDTVRMATLLESKEEVLDAGPAGTTFRFLTAYLAFRPETKVLTGSDRMKQRPIGLLVNALSELGADIEYLENEGFPPLKIKAPKRFPENPELTIPANVSSQFISALLLIGAGFKGGLKLHLDGKIVSRSYINMTLEIMKRFGVNPEWNQNSITVPETGYESHPFTVEADWSAASYFYSIASLSERSSLLLKGLFKDSVQGDSILAEMMKGFGVRSEFTSNGVKLYKDSEKGLPYISNGFAYDFILCPDIAQSLAVVCAGVGIKGELDGLETLRIKETDRIAALGAELNKVGVRFYTKPDQLNVGVSEGKAVSKLTIPVFDTYHDHRMAMAFAPLALSLGNIIINDPLVVNKSYPDFWRDLQELGFQIKQI